MSEDEIRIQSYDSRWPALAAKEILILKEIFKKYPWFVDIQHIGSTAIPGLAAKPIIDIYLGVQDISKIHKEIIKSLEDLGYSFWRDNPNKEKLFLVKGMPPFGSARTHHLHIVKYMSDYWQARVIFRDYLRNNPDEIKRYAELKFKLAEKYSRDREAYTDAKTDYISRVLQKAGFKEKVRR